MSLEQVMNTGGRVGHSKGSTITGGIWVITSLPSPTTKAGGLPVYRGPLSYLFSGGSHPAFVSGSVVAVKWPIQPTAAKTTVDGLAPIRVGDGATMLCTGQFPSGGVGTVEGGIEIVDAGQDKVRAQ